MPWRQKVRGLEPPTGFPLQAVERGATRYDRGRRVATVGVPDLSHRGLERRLPGDPDTLGEDLIPLVCPADRHAVA